MTQKRWPERPRARRLPRRFGRLLVAAVFVAAALVVLLVSLPVNADERRHDAVQAAPAVVTATEVRYGPDLTEQLLAAGALALSFAAALLTRRITR